MAARAQPLTRWPGTVAAMLVGALVLGCLAAVVLRAEAGRGLGASDWAAVRFTVLQAGLSALFSVALAIPVARALARRRFIGRRVMISMLGAPFILPVIIAVLGLLQVFGRSGWISQMLVWLGMEPVQIFGLHGVVLAHVFFNLPLATRLILQGWQEIPAERFRLAATLGANPRAMWQLLERPMLKHVLPGALAVVFAVCLTSFAVAITLGGGPRATTIELAIYQAFRFDFDLGRAALLSGVQIILTMASAYAALRFAVPTRFGSGLDRPLTRWDTQTTAVKVTDTVVLAVTAGFVALPLLAVVVSGITGLTDLPAAVIRSAFVSISVAAASTGLLMLLALPMAVAVAVGRGSMVEMAGLLGMAASPLVIGTGLFIFLNPFTDPVALALVVTAMVNAVSALPFALRILVPRARQVIGDHGRLGVSLGMAGWAFAGRVFVPRMRAQIGFAAGLGAALSMGDLGVVMLFADPDRATLPAQIYRLMGAYRMEQAQGAALLLLLLSVGAFWIFDRGARWHAEA